MHQISININSLQVSSYHFQMKQLLTFLLTLSVSIVF